MDATEIARLRERPGFCLTNRDVRSLIDALEQAQKERDELVEATAEQTKACERLVVAANAMKEAATTFKRERDQAQKDTKDARALLGHIAELSNINETIRARIAAMLEKKP